MLVLRDKNRKRRLRGTIAEIKAHVKVDKRKKGGVINNQFFCPDDGREDDVRKSSQKNYHNPSTKSALPLLNTPHYYSKIIRFFINKNNS